jgi:uncharacterized protein
MRITKIAPVLGFIVLAMPLARAAGTSSQAKALEGMVRIERKLAEQGNAVGENALGAMYEYGNGVPQDYKLAAQWLRKAAEQGEPYAQLNLAQLYERGEGVPQSYPLAAHWLRKAAQQGNATAASDLGALYEGGQGVARSSQLAQQWLRKAAQDNAATDRRQRKDWLLNFDALRRAANHGNAWSQYFLGLEAEDGVVGAGHVLIAPRNYPLAAQWFGKAAAQGFARAQNNLASLYEQGKGVPQSYQLAAQWYRKAANQGYPQAQCALGQLYLHGQGVDQSDELAAKWFRRSAEQDFAPAQVLLGIMYQKGEGMPANTVQAEMLYDLAVAPRESQLHPAFEWKVKLLRWLLAVALSPAQTAEARTLAAEWQKGKPLPAAP